MRVRRVLLAVVIASAVGLGSAWAQIAVTDPATTGRNAVIAALTDHIVEAVRAQQERLQRMAKRLSADTNMHKYASPEPPPWRADGDGEPLTYGNAYRGALTSGDPTGSAYAEVARERLPAADALAGLSPAARSVMEQALATLDAADSANIIATHQAGMLRAHGRSEQRAIDTLESDVIDPSDAQSTTAVLDKISAAGLLETQQKQARLQYLTAIVEQLLIDNKRARDTEASVLNMRLRQLQRTRDEDAGFVAGASDDLRNWSQP